MREVTIKRSDIEFCCYAVMMRDNLLDDYAVALFNDLEDAEDYIEKHYTIQMTLNDEIYIAKVISRDEL